jgi:hypothetical protein
MIDLVNKIIFDLKKSFKPFIIIYIIFVAFFYMNDIWKKKVSYNYTSSLLISEPSSISNWAEFDEVFFRQSLHLYVENLDTKLLIKENCSIDTRAKHIIDTNFLDNNFRYTLIKFDHENEINSQCMRKIYNNKILTFYNEFLERAIEDNKIISDYLKTKTPVINSNLFMSTFKKSFRGPRLVSTKSNKFFKKDMDFNQILIISFIFSAILSILISFVYDEKKFKNTLKKFKVRKK